MAIPLNVFRAQVDNLITADDAVLKQLARDRQTKAAVEKYSHDAPDETTEDEAGDAGKYYALTGDTPVLADWVEGFSRIIEIEYPAVTIASDSTPTYLEREDWRDDYWASGVRYLFLPTRSPAATETMRIRYTTPYAWTASSVTVDVSQAAHGFIVGDYVYQDTTWFEADSTRTATHKVTVKATDTFTAAELEADVPTQDFFALCYLAASICCQAIAAQFALIGDSTILADSVAHSTNSSEYARRAEEFLERYNQHMGIGADPGQLQGTGDFVDLDTAPGWPAGRRYIFHGNR